MPTEGALNIITEKFFSEYNRELEKLPVEQRPKSTLQFSEEISYFLHFASYYIHGKNIFQFLPAMIEQFQQTDVDEVLFSSLQFPYNVYYLSFGLQEHFNLWDEGYFLDGAYVVFHPGTLQIILSTIRKDIDYSQPLNFITCADKYYYFPFEIQDENQTVAQAMGISLKKHVRFEHTPKPDETGLYNIDGRNVYIHDIKNETDQLVTDRNKRGFQVFKEALKLVVNGICYLAAYRNEIEETFPDDAPEKLTEKYINANKPKIKKQAITQLTQLGYSKIQLCGKSLQSHVEYSGEHGKEIRPHWRRGHWRNQAYGKGLEEHKLIWIKPTIVRRDKGDA